MPKFVWRSAMFASINHHFSAYNIFETAELYRAYHSENPDTANFVDFVWGAGFCQSQDYDHWMDGVGHFSPGTFDLISVVVDRNLRPGNHLLFDGRVAKPQGDTPLPMMFERRFDTSESIVVKPTTHGIKVIMTTTVGGYLESEPGKEAGNWPGYASEREEPGD